jgi:hypothetical protein
VNAVLSDLDEASPRRAEKRKETDDINYRDQAVTLLNSKNSKNYLLCGEIPT